MAKWNSAKIVTFLNIYQTYPMLYDKKNPEYNNRECREKAVQDVIEKLRQNGIEVSTEEFRKKTKSIRQTFANELIKMKKSAEEETIDGEIYTPKLIWFQNAKFFAEHLNSKKVDETILQSDYRSESETDISFIAADRLKGEYEFDQTDNLQDSDTEFLVPNTPQSNVSSVSPSAKRKCLEYIDSMETMIEKLDKMQKLRNKEDSIDIFCKLLNKDMRELTPKNQLLFRQKVSNFMMKLKLEQLGSHDVEVVEFDFQA